jgi:alpha-galactosidase
MDLICETQIKNHGRDAVTIKEIVLFDLELPFPPGAKLYGEGFRCSRKPAARWWAQQTLAITPTPNTTNSRTAELESFYGMMMLSPSARDHHLFAFTTCRRFMGQFISTTHHFRSFLTLKAAELRPVRNGSSNRSPINRQRSRTVTRSARDTLLRQSSTTKIHAPPTGWCSWYCFGPARHGQQVLDNLDFIAKHTPGLRYVPDRRRLPARDGRTGSKPAPAFGGIRAGRVERDPRTRLSSPAICGRTVRLPRRSRTFSRGRPDIFVKDADGAPLRSDRVTFGGWRRGPGYVLDGTHPEVQQYFRTVFWEDETRVGASPISSSMQTSWGAIHGGRFYNKRATRIEAYRQGMYAILDGGA